MLTDMINKNELQMESGEELKTRFKKISLELELAKKTLADETAKQKHTERQILDYQKKLQRLSAELTLAEARERREIASNLHDHVGQALAFVRMKLSQLQGNSVFCGFEDDFGGLVKLLDQTIRYTRNLTGEISPPILYELGLIPAIEWLVEQTQKKYDFKVALKISGRPSFLSEDVKITLFKSIQELIANIVKHADAKNVNIYAEWSDKNISLLVVDDGSGFDLDILENRLSKNESFGLFSIRERLKNIGGDISLESKPDFGTSVRISVPLTLRENPDFEN